MGNRYRGRGWAVALAMLLGTFGATAARGSEAASLVIVFDGSSSMWGNVDGARASKLVVARESVRRALGKIGSQTRVGLASFGHRRGDCADVEVMRPPEPVDVTRLLEPLEKLNPRGRGPLTLAIREAAKSLPPAPGKRSLVLIHDDADNCQQNVCVGAQELRAAGVTVHVIGLALKPDDLARTACLPQITGGRLFHAQNAEQVGTAVEEALKLASSDAGRIEAPGQPKGPQPSARPGVAVVPKPPADAPPGLYLRALLAPRSEPLALTLNWTVTSEGEPREVLFSGRAASPHVPAAPGRYVVEARDGPVSASTTAVVVDKGPTVVEVVLNAGTLRVRAQAQKGGAAMADAIVSISETGQAGENRKDAPIGQPLAAFKGSEGMAILPAGRYLVRVEQGLVRADRSVVVPVGSQGLIEVPVNAARLQLSAVGKDIAEAADTLVFSIAEDDPDAPSGRREVARSAARQADFVLPPGTYYVIARLGIIEARESLAVGPGDVVKRTLSVASGKLVLATKAMGAAAPNEPVSYRIERIDGSPQEAITTSRPAPVLVLLGGRYRVEGRYGVMNAKVVREIEVKAGQTQQLTLEHQVASLKLRLTGSSGAPLTEVFWDVKDEAGATVWTSGQSEPSAMLQAGRYRIRAETREKRYDRTIELRSGEARVVELAAN